MKPNLLLNGIISICAALVFLIAVLVILPATIQPTQASHVHNRVQVERPQVMDYNEQLYRSTTTSQLLGADDLGRLSIAEKKVFLANDLSITVSAVSTVLSGDTITYTIQIKNNSQTATATEISLFNDPPDSIQIHNINCDDCVQQVSTINIPVGQGYPGGTITITELITWPIFTLAPDASRSFVLTIDTPCQSEGRELTNQAFMNYQQDGLPGAGFSEPLITTVLLPPNQSEDIGLAERPSWCADNIRAVFDLDWGDFDRDGDLDLALASTAGMVVFENEEGQLVEFQTTTTYTLGVHWADIYTNNTTLELVAIGDFLNNLPPFTGGRNYIFGLDGGQLTQIDYFTSELQLGKIVSGDFVGNDGIVELVASTNFPEHDTACLVILYENLGDFTGPGDCVSQKGSTNLNAADFNNDGYLDLALSSFDFLGGGEAFVIVNNGEGITATTVTPVAIDSGLTSTPSELVWGDYDRDGYLDIAEALPRGNHKNRVRVYRNLAGMGFTMTQEITTVRGPFAIEWGDFDRDGYLDLMLEDVPPRYYRYTGGTPLFEGFQLSQLSDLTRIRRMRGIDYDNDGDLDFSMTDLFEPSRFFEVVAPSLSLSLEPVSAIKANSVTWGDVDGDERLDLLFGAGISQLGSRIYRNIGPSFVQTAIFTGSGFGPHSAAFGDVNADGMLDTAISTFGLNQIFYNGVNNVPNWRSTTALASHEIAWADSDLDNRGLLDLLVANNGRNALYLNSGLQTASSGSVWESDEVEDTRSVAWGYFDDDLLPDFAAGNDNQPTRVYRNLDGQSFQVVWSSHSSFTGNTRDVAWGDYDLDGDMDLAVGNFGQPNYIYENLGNMSLSATPVWTSTTFDQTPAFSKTTSLAWGDWNNDGRLDLAVGNYGEKDQVYADVGISSQAVLTLLWESEEHHQTTDVAWGDRDNDGDLDLAISQDGNGQNGVYTNTYVLAAHLANNFTQFMPLPNNPSYLSIGRPGRTKDAYLFSSAEVFSITQPLNPPTVALEVAIPFRVYDPDGTRDVSQLDALGDRIAGVDYHFSLDGGITWKKATSVTLDYDQTTSRLGQTGIITWNAGLDLGNTAEEAVSDDVRFRLSIVHENNGGPVQKVATSAVSPPFRIRRLTCLWPNNPTIEIQVMGGLDSPTRFFGRVSEAEKDVVYSWDFGDGEPVELNQGQLIEHTYKSPGVYTVELTVSGQACPTTRVAVTTRQLVIGGAKIYLPLILKPGSSRQITDIITTSEPTENIIKQIITGPDAPAQVTGVHGEVTFDGSGTQLNWEPNLVDDVVLGYRVYRSPVGQASLQLLASTPPEIRRYTDTTAICGYYYFITAFNRFGESLASDTSYYSPPCR